MDLLLITGPAGVGKSTLAWEIGAQLAAADIAHAVVESDELDRVHPKPTREQLDRLKPGTIDISSLNLAALWSTYQALGHTKLVMSGVMTHLSFDRRWILAAIPDANLTVVRLTASQPELLARIAQRETNPEARAAQTERSLHQAGRMAGETGVEAVYVATDGRSPQHLAGAILRDIGWL